MAELSSQDVVNRVQSTDASASVDVSASTTNSAAAAAANSSANANNNSITSATVFTDSVEEVNEFSESREVGSGRHERGSSQNNQRNDGQKIETDTQESLTSDALAGQVENGMHDNIAQAESDSGRRSAAGSTGQSITSEGDAILNDGSEMANKPGDSVPRYVVKKPSTFKPVSVTKNFLAKAGTPSSQLVKTASDLSSAAVSSASTFATNTARPRLVAKTGSGHKLSMSTQLNDGNRSKQTTGPDPMQVWNRNRVQQPQATPKHLTNEELREQYGIQLASIPIGDGDDKGNKWADIDDEEDDWAPEVIEWSDGSKVNLAEAEKKAAAEREKEAAEVKKREEAAKAAREAAKQRQPLGLRATVLKVGAAAAAAQAKAANDPTGAATKSTDKPTLVAKPVAPAPVKSPWATLPPVDKVSPVPVTPPTMPLSTSIHRPPLTESQAVDRGPTPWRHAKEIEADDFSRIPRDAQSAVPRELFNSQSGKYEPVSHGRRESIRHEQNFRPPSVLQRPGPEQDTTPLIARRRDSEVQQIAPELDDELSFDQRHLEDKSNTEHAQPWRRQPGAWVPNHMRGSLQPSMNAHQPQQYSGDVNAGVPGPTEPQGTSSQPQEDPVTVQKRLMREAREAAIKRRQEEEAKEEAERKERIRKKLEAMGPLPEKKEKEKPLDIASTATVSTGPLTSQTTDSVTSTISAKDDMPRSPPKPPVPTAAGPPQQYGMMKVHPSPLPNGSNGHSLTQQTGSAMKPVDERRSPPKISPVPQSVANGSVPEQKANVKPVVDDGRVDMVQSERSKWSNSLGQVSKGWERPSEVQNMLANPNLWAPSSHRNLGNGDFNSLGPQSRGHFRQQQISPDSILPSPQAVAPPRLFQEEKSPSAGFAESRLTGSLNTSQNNETNISGGVSPFGPSELPSIGMHPQPPATQSRTPGLPSPLAHNLSVQSSMPPPQSKGFSSLPEPRSTVDAWASFASTVTEHDAATRARLAQERNRQMVEAQSQGRQAGSRHYNETWKQVTRGEDLGSRQIINIHTNTRSQQQSSSPTGIVDDVSRQSPVTMPAQHPRPSRFHTFFGQHDQANVVLPPHLQVRQVVQVRPGSPPAPPPDSASHPAFDRISNRPRVRLPGQDYEDEIPERPIVKLPPPKALPQHPIVAELRGMPPPLRGPAQPLAKTLIWQHRFDGLFNRVPESRAMEPTEFSSSKATFDILSVNESTSVHFPQPGQISPVSPKFALSLPRGRSIDEEEALFDGEQDPGSTPPVRVPAANKYPSDWRPAPVPSTKRLQLADHEILSRFVWIVGLEDFQGKRVVVSVKLPGMATGKKLDMTGNSNLRNPRMFSKSGGFPKAKPFPRNGRPPREIQERLVAPQPTGARQTLSNSTAAKPGSTATASPAAPTTWAKHISAGI